MSTIVVGLDVSSASRAALAWAAHQARTTGADLRAVHALPSAVFTAIGVSVPATSVAGADKAEEAYRTAVTAVWETVQPEPAWQLEFINADPGRLLVTESTRADLLVVGTREHVGWGRVLNGSISHYCLSHAECPVAAVPATAAFTSISDGERRAGHGAS